MLTFSTQSILHILYEVLIVLSNISLCTQNTANFGTLHHGCVGDEERVKLLHVVLMANRLVTVEMLNGFPSARAYM